MSSGVPPTTAAWSFARFMGLFWSSGSSHHFALFTCSCTVLWLSFTWLVVLDSDCFA
jgi:hypothetical protein